MKEFAKIMCYALGMQLIEYNMNSKLHYDCFCFLLLQ